jgi:coenzyme F420-reducing hydrogenase delta subunit
LADSILIMHCKEGAKRALARMTEEGYKLPARFKTFELPCTGSVNEVLLMENLQNGASGVIVLGCRRVVEMVFAAPDEGKRLHETLLRLAREGQSEGKHE